MRRNFRVKTLQDGRAMLNLGCGFRTDPGWNNIDFSFYARLAHHGRFADSLRAIGLLSKDRHEKLSGIDPGILLWNLRNGIPFHDETFDVLYQSHLLEHFDRDAARGLMKECRRVLKKGGIIRVAVPDLRFLIDNYCSAVSRLEDGDVSALNDHRQAVCDLLEPMVRKGLDGERHRNFLAKAIERFVQKRLYQKCGVHQWMYDRYSLRTFLTENGFKDINERGPSESRIAGWAQFNFDIVDGDKAYKPESIYIEGVR